MHKLLSTEHSYCLINIRFTESINLMGFLFHAQKYKHFFRNMFCFNNMIQIYTVRYFLHRPSEFLYSYKINKSYIKNKHFHISIKMTDYSISIQLMPVNLVLKM